MRPWRLGLGFLAIGAAAGLLLFVSGRDSAPEARVAPSGDGVGPGEDESVAPTLAGLPGRPPGTGVAGAAAARKDDLGANLADSGISGRVIGPDGQPARGVIVRPFLPADPGERATTDDQGRFVLDSTVGARGGLWVSAPGFAGFLVSERDLEAGSPITLKRGWTISGTVADAETGASIAPVTVHALPSVSPAGPLPAVADWREDRSFVIGVPAAGTYVLDVGEDFVGNAAPAAEWIPTRVEGVAAGASDVKILMSRGRSIEGRVVDEVGESVAFPLLIEARGRTAAGDPDFTARRMVLVPAGGTFRIPGLRPGRYDLYVRPFSVPEVDGSGPVSATVVQDVEAGTQGLHVRLARGVTLVGRLDDGAGQAVLGKGLVHAYREGETERNHGVSGLVPGDGTFRVGPLDEGYRYDVVATGFAGRKEGIARGVSPRDVDVVITLPGARSIRGRVEDDTGKPVPAGVPVGVAGEGSDPRATGMRLFAYTAADGTFTADGLAEFTFSVQAGGGRSGYGGPSVAGVQPGTTDLVLKVSVGVELSGTLVDEKGAPVATTSLEADDGTRIAAMRPYAQVGSDGRFLLRGLAAGTVRLSARVGQASVPVGTVVAPAADVKVTLPP